MSRIRNDGFSIRDIRGCFSLALVTPLRSVTRLPFAFSPMTSGGDFIARPLARLLEIVLQAIVGFLGGGFDAIPVGLRGVLGLIELLVQGRRLVAQGLEFRFGVRLDRIAGVVDFGGERVDFLVQSVWTLSIC